MSVAANIAQLLITQGIGVAGSSIFVGQADESNSLSILLLDTGGPAPNPYFTRDFKEIEIVVTGVPNGYAAAYTKAETIKNYLLGLDNQTFGTDTYFSFIMRSDITFVGYNENNQPKFTLNFRVIVDGANTGNRLSL